MAALEVRTPVRVASAMAPASTDPTRRLIDLCHQVGADTYLSGAGGADYLRTEDFAREGLRLEFQHYEPPRYPQGPGRDEFVPCLSVLDMLFWGTDRLP